MSRFNEDGVIKNQLDGYDIGVIIFYFLFVLTVGLWSSHRSKRGTVTGYFLASRNMNWIPAIFILMLLGYIFVPVYMSSGVYTMPEYLRERFGGQRIRIYLSFLTLLLYIFTKISADLYAGALFIQLSLNKNTTEWLYISILILLIMAAMFTIAGGLTAVIWTDFVQTILMIIGSVILMAAAFARIGGFNNLVTSFPYAVAKRRAGNGSCGIPPKDYMNLLRSPYPGETDLPWTGMTIGLAINSIWYWCTDQVIVQRTLASKNMSHAKGGCILASYLKLLPLWLIVFPGMIARVVFPERVACSDPDTCFAICRSRGGCTNIAYVELVIKLLPSGLSGLMMAVMLAALMSSLTSIFNSASTVFTIDVWTRFRKKPTDLELLIVGRLFVLVLVGVSVIWIPVIEQSGNSKLFDYIQSVSSFLSPPVCAVFLLAFFWPRTNEPGAFYGLMIGLIVGLIRFILEFTYPPPLCGTDEPDERPQFIKDAVDNIHYLHFSCFLFIITCLVTLAISYMTPPIPEECLYRLTFATRCSTKVRVHIHSKKKKSQETVTENGSIRPIDQLQVDEQQAEVSRGLKILSKLCGITKASSMEDSPMNGDDLSKEEIAKKSAEFLEEDYFWSIFVDVNAVICMCVTIFFWGAFA